MQRPQGGPSSGRAGDRQGGSGGDDGLQDDGPIDDSAPLIPEDCHPDALPGVHRLSRTEYLNTMADLFPGYDGALKFPADAAISGFDNEAAALHPNGLLVEAMASNASAVAAWAVRDLDGLVECDPAQISAGEQDRCARDFIARIGLRALRAPLDPTLVDSYMELFTQYRDEIDFAAAIELTLGAMLQAPELMYRISPRVTTDPPEAAKAYAVASQLAYGLWQAPPDGELLQAAADGALDTPEGASAELGKLAARAPDKLGRTLRDFHRQWLELDRVLSDVWNVKDRALFPEWDATMVDAVHRESLDFVDEVMFTQAGGLRELLTSRTARVDADTAWLYDVGGKPGLVELPETRAGIFARASFLASHAHQRNGSPPLRGIAIMDRLFCLTVGDPPPDADTSNPGDDADASEFTNRELFERRASAEPCNSCHKVINAFAYPLEAFDAIGRFRSEDNGEAVDTTTEILGTDIDGSYDDWPEVAAAMADSAKVRDCVAEHWLEFTLGRQLANNESCLLDDVARGMAEGESFIEVLKRSALHAALAEVE